MGPRILAVHTIDLKESSSSLTRPANVTPYLEGDCISDVTTNNMFTFTECLPINKSSGELISARMSISSAVVIGPSIDLFLFHTEPSEVADNVPASFSIAEMDNCIGVISFAECSWHNGGSSNVSFIDPNSTLSLPINILAGGIIYGQAVARNKYIPTSGEIFKCTLGFK